MRFGVHVLSYGSTWSETLETVQLAERAGFDLVGRGGDPLGADRRGGADPRPALSYPAGSASPSGIIQPGAGAIT